MSGECDNPLCVFSGFRNGLSPFPPRFPVRGARVSAGIPQGHLREGGDSFQGKLLGADYEIMCSWAQIFFVVSHSTAQFESFKKNTFCLWLFPPSLIVN